MNIKIQNISNAFKKDLRLFAQASDNTIILYPSRCQFQSKTLYSIISGETFSKFPRNASEDFVNGTTTINFSNGTITGADDVSLDFSAINPSVGQAVIGIVAIDKNDRLFIRNNSSQTISAATFDFNNGAFPILKGKVPLHGFLITNESGTRKVAQICDLRPDLNNVPFDTADLIYENSDNFSIGTVFREYLQADAASSQSQIRIRSTRLKRGDSISVLSSTTAAQNRTVLTVDRGVTFDTITLDQNLSVSVTLANNAYVTINNFSDLSQAFAGSGKILYDTSWRSCLSGATDTLTHNLNMPLGTYFPVVFFNTTQSMSGAFTISNYTYNALSTRVGVQVRLTSSTSVVRFGGSGIINSINASGLSTGLVTSGFYRLLLLGN